MGKQKGAEVPVTEYYMSIHLGLCAEADAITEIIIGEKTAWAGEITAEGAIGINNPALFGGVKKEGGVKGVAYALFGSPLQMMPSALAARFGLTRENCPGFRGLTSLFFVGEFSNDPGWTPVPGTGGGSGGGGGSDTGWTPPGGGRNSIREYQEF